MNRLRPGPLSPWRTQKGAARAASRGQGAPDCNPASVAASSSVDCSINHSINYRVFGDWQFRIGSEATFVVGLATAYFAYGDCVTIDLGDEVSTDHVITITAGEADDYEQTRA